MANANFTIVLTDAQQATMTRIVAGINAQQGTNLSVAQFIQLQVPSILRPYELKFAEEDAIDVGAKYKLASPDIQQQVRTLLA